MKQTVLASIVVPLAFAAAWIGIHNDRVRFSACVPLRLLQPNEAPSAAINGKTPGTPSHNGADQALESPVATPGWLLTANTPSSTGTSMGLYNGGAASGRGGTRSSSRLLTASAGGAAPTRNGQSTGFVVGSLVKYQRLFDEVVFDPDVRGQLAAVLMDEQSRVVQNLLQTTADLRTPTEQAIAYRTEIAKTDEEIRRLLRPDQAAAVLEYRRTLPYQPVIDDFVAGCAAAGISILPSDVATLAGTLADVHILMPQSNRTYTELEQGVYTLRDAKVLTALQGRLTPAQLNVLRQSLAGRINRKDQ